MRRIRESLSH
jgi:hypothetical protein